MWKLQRGTPCITASEAHRSLQTSSSILRARAVGARVVLHISSDLSAGAASGDLRTQAPLWKGPGQAAAAAQDIPALVAEWVRTCHEIPRCEIGAVLVASMPSASLDELESPALPDRKSVV